MFSSLKGWYGEKKTAFWLSLLLSAKRYHIFNNLIIPSSNGTAQIDHLIISKYGVFIIETKNKKGWIFGSSDNKTWTQVIYKRKYSFQNPLFQTYRQKNVLANFLGISKNSIHTVVKFAGNSSFKTSMPRNVMRYGLARYIKSFDETLLSEILINSMVDILTHHRKHSTLNKRAHLKSLKERHNSRNKCPKCGGKLVMRIARKALNTNSKFYGCSNFPNCRFTRDL
jgi:hypothetical protein